MRTPTLNHLRAASFGRAAGVRGDAGVGGGGGGHATGSSAAARLWWNARQAKRCIPNMTPPLSVGRSGGRSQVKVPRFQEFPNRANRRRVTACPNS
jgi:hypothetical protein